MYVRVPLLTLLIACLCSTPPDLRAQELPGENVYIAPDEAPAPAGGIIALVRTVRYPEAALRDSATGRVTARFVVTPDGKATNIRLLETAHPALNEEVRRALRAASFTPGRVEDKPVAAWLSVPFRFENPAARSRRPVKLGIAPPRAAVPGPSDPTPSNDPVPSNQQPYSSGAEGSALDTADVVEEQPRLIGGMKRLQELVRYPKQAQAVDAGGRVLVQFIVGKNGRPEPASIRIMKSAGNIHLDREAARVVTLMRFVPGKQEGEPVRVKMSIPITFNANRDDGPW